MNPIDQQLHTIKQEKRIGLMTHVVIGYPSLSTTEKLVRMMEKVGVDFVELQIPFSDPLADGPTIMQACDESLKKGTKVKDAFVLMKKLSSQLKTPLLFMAYYNTVYAYGTEQFCRDAKLAGASGLIIPDVPLDEEPEENFLRFCKKYQLYAVRVLSPASTDERLRKNAAVAQGFIYCTSRQGITGTHKSISPQLADLLRRLKKYTDLPVAVGFGISTKQHINLLSHKATIAVVGSAVVELLAQGRTVPQIERYIRSLI